MGRGRLSSVIFAKSEVFMNRLREPSSWAGLGLIANGIADCLQGNYQTGVVNLITGLVAVFKPEAKNV